MSAMIHSVNLCSQCQTQIFIPRFNATRHAELNSKLRSPAAPEPCEVERVLTLLTRDLDDYDSEIARLQSRIILIERKKERLHACREKLCSLSSPVRKLPNEILSRVFELACDKNNFLDGPELDEEDESSIPSKHIISSSLRSLPSLSISSVCYRWRALAQSLPGLWSSLKIEIFTSSRETVSKGFMSTLQYYLKKSRTRPLLLELSVQKEDEDDPVDATPFTLLLQHVQRWKSLSILKDTDLSAHVDPLGITQFPYLEHLCAFRIEDIGCFESVPKLRSLQTRYTTPVPLHSNLPLDQLTTLITRCPPRSKMDSVFQLCPNLVSLRLNDSANLGHLRALPTTQGASNKLRSLSLTGDGYEKESDFFETVFTAFTLPSLTQLDITLLDPGYIWPRKAFSDFISRSSCHITSFTSNMMGYSDLDVIFIFHHLPFLESLTLNDGFVKEGQYSITPRLISHLHGYDTDGQGSLSSPLLPKLRHLSLIVESQTFDDEALVKMVSSRWLSDPEDVVAARTDCLRSFVLRFRHRAVDETIYKPLFCLEDMGMRVVITGKK